METDLHVVHVSLVDKKPENTHLPNVKILTRLFEIKLDFPFYFSFFTAGAPYNPSLVTRLELNTTRRLHRPNRHSSSALHPVRSRLPAAHRREIPSVSVKFSVYQARAIPPLENRNKCTKSLIRLVFRVYFFPIDTDS